MSENNNVTGRLPNLALQKERLRRGWTQQELADQVGTTVVNVSRWERGITFPNAYFRKKLCQIFKKDASALGILPVRQMTQSEMLPIMEDIIPEPLEAEPTLYSYYDPSLTLQSFFLRQRGTLLTVFSVVVAILLMGSGMLIQAYFFSPSQQGHQVIAAAQAGPSPVIEDGGIDGWSEEGHITRMEDSIAVGGYNHGTQALQVTLFSEKQNDMPFISINPHNHPQVGQTLSAALFVPANTSSTIKAELYAADPSFHWLHGSFPILTPGKWNYLTFLLPAFPSPIFEVGIQFLSAPYNIPVTVYVDAFQWN